MADTQIRMNQLDQIQDPTGGIALINKGGVDVITPVEKILTTAGSLSDADKQKVLEGLSAYSKQGVSTEIQNQIRDYAKNIQNLLVSGQQFATILNNLPDQIKLYVADQIATTISKINSNADLVQRVLTAQQQLVTIITQMPSNKTIEDLELKLLRSLQTNGIISSALLSTLQSGSNNSDFTGNAIVLPKPTSLVWINLNIASIPGSKSQDAVQGVGTIISEGASWTGSVAVSVQGASSASYPKKNLNIDFLTTDYSDDVNVKLGDIMPLSTLTYKANWIDVSQCRNVMGYRLWEEVVQSRNEWPLYEVDHKYDGKSGLDSYFTGAKGFPMGYECALFVNNLFYGIGHIMSGKKRDSYNISKNKPLEILLDNGNWNTISNFTSAVSKGDIEVKAPKKPTDDTTAAIAAWDAWTATVIAKTSDINDLYNHVNKTNIVDFILHTQMLNASDTISGDSIKNTQVMSYDGKVFYFMPYDLDTTLGLGWWGGGFSQNWNDDRFGGKFWPQLIALVGQDQFNARWKTLRDSGIYSVKNFIKLIRNVQTKYTPDLYALETAKWPTLPEIDNHTTQQMITWVTNRLAVLDKKYGYTS